ncbi:CLUMA_CG006804, isoform A [Clunio marinus]|uniref:CLUMA_CG006804, isoform A n=1 Tax=Clunio marinus TaxID=568069 RepID=A0A1J1HZ07_9DIPT|nr:CLUMA_CG006804, isoform A [Clunio marinus]
MFYMCLNVCLLLNQNLIIDLSLHVHHFVLHERVSQIKHHKLVEQIHAMCLRRSIHETINSLSKEFSTLKVSENKRKNCLQENENCVRKINFSL